MARNKYPEQTVDKIVEVSLRLFMEKGYDHTTVQDIVDRLGGLTKGAVYHHFKGKEDIFDAVLDRLFSAREADLTAIVRDRTLSGRDKLRRMMTFSLQDPAQDQLFTIAPSLSANDRLLSAQLLQVQEIARDYIEPAIREGIADGSVRAEHPAALAELFLLASNFGLNPLIFDITPAQMAEKIAFCRGWLALYGLEDLIDDTAERRLIHYCELVAETRAK